MIHANVNEQAHMGFLLLGLLLAGASITMLPSGVVPMPPLPDAGSSLTNIVQMGNCVGEAYPIVGHILCGATGGNAD